MRAREFLRNAWVCRGLKVPATNNAEVNAAVGMQDYQVNGAIMALKDVEPPMLIDLLEWQQPEMIRSPTQIYIVLV